MFSYILLGVNYFEMYAYIFGHRVDYKVKFPSLISYEHPIEKHFTFYQRTMKHLSFH
jgi:hypothetical protein